MIDDLSRFLGGGDRTKQIRLVPFDIARQHVSSDYIVFEEELYLKVQETQGALILTTFVKRFEWPKERLNQLIVEHPELKVYTE